MTLIIGCITPQFAILAGDTQLTVGDLQRGANLKREVEIKVTQYSHRFVMGILGKWSWFDGAKDGKATYINVYDSLNKFLRNKDNEKDCLKAFLSGYEHIHATAIYINRTADGFEMDSVSNKGNNDLSRISIGKKDIIFNEPFYHYRKAMVSEKIVDFFEENNLDESLGDTLFLFNNVILGIIAQGKHIDIVTDEEIPFLNAENTVGGYVTIQVMTNNIHTFNCLYRGYNFDYNTLLDKTTFAFSNFADRHPEIKYIDNICMLIKASIDGNIEPYVREEILNCIKKQLIYLADNNLVPIYILNEIIVIANEKYNLALNTIIIVDQDDEINLDLMFGDDFDTISIEYYKRFI